MIESAPTKWIATLELSYGEVLHVLVGASDFWTGEARLFMEELASKGVLDYPLKEVPADWTCSDDHVCETLPRKDASMVASNSTLTLPSSSTRTDPAH